MLHQAISKRADLTGTIFKVGALTELHDVQRVISLEQRSVFHVPSATLSIALIVCVLSSLALSLVMLVVQLRNERARMALEALADKARRLRMKDSKALVHVPAIQAGGFHIFLSHVWGTGQGTLLLTSCLGRGKGAQL